MKATQAEAVKVLEALANPNTPQSMKDEVISNLEKSPDRTSLRVAKYLASPAHDPLVADAVLALARLSPGQRYDVKRLIGA